MLAQISDAEDPSPSQILWRLVMGCQSPTDRAVCLGHQWQDPPPVAMTHERTRRDALGRQTPDVSTVLPHGRHAMDRCQSSISIPQLRTSPATSEDSSSAVCRHVVMHSILSDNDEGRSSVCDRREIHPRLSSRQGCRSGTSFCPDLF